MNATESLYDSSSLALAAYATLTPGSTNDQNRRAALEAVGMTARQAEDFARRYPTVVTQFNDTATSFSVTVFADASGSLTLAIRGTLEAGDFFPTDTNIALRGAGYDQIVALYNWWMRATSAAGQSVSQSQIASFASDGSGQPPPDALFLYSSPMAGVSPGTSITNNFYLVSAPAASATGELVSALSADSDHRVEVTGHSLGAHLALAFNSLFPGAANQVIGFNTPGIKDSPINRQFFERLGGSIPSATDSGNVTHVLADESNIGDTPWNAIAGLYSPPGTTVNISIENQWLSDEPKKLEALNHSQVILTDALAVFDLLSQLDPSLSPAHYKAILHQAAQGTAASYERIVDTLEKFFGIDNTFLPSGNEYRDALYGAIYVLRRDAGFQALAGKLTVMPVTASNASLLVTSAQSDFGEFLALKTLSPFTLKPKAGMEGAAEALNAVLSGVHDADHQAWAADEAVRRAGDAAKDLHFTDAWYADRAAFLGWKLLANRRDSAGVSWNEVGDWQFRDLASGEEVYVAGKIDPAGPQLRYALFGSREGEMLPGAGASDRLYGGGGADILDGGEGADYLEGNAGADELRGGEGGDLLRGGAGADLLQGGKGADRLEGGEGSDHYLYASGDGWDVIADSDGLGRVFYDGQALAGGEQVGPNLWQSADGRLTYTLTHGGNGNAALSVLGPGGGLLVEDFSSGALGIELRERVPAIPSAPAGGREIRGDYGYKVFTFPYPQELPPPPPGYLWSAELSPGSRQYLLVDELGNLVRDPAKPYTGGWQNLIGSAGPDTIVMGDAGGTIGGYGGDDFIQGGRGVEWIGADAGNDYVEGGNPDLPYPQTELRYPDGELITGAVDDRIGGGSGDDVLIGGESGDLLSWIEGTATPAGEKGDWLDGGAGADQLHGSAGDDALLGGGGKDVILGGPGDDFLDGDDSYTPFHPVYVSAGLWKIEREAGSFSARLYPVFSPQAPDYEYYKVGGDGDLLFGGDGNDLMLGMLGDDLLAGEDGDDVLAGWEGDDTLLGGAGDDLMAGDFGGYEQPNARPGWSLKVSPGAGGLYSGDSGPVEQQGRDYLDGGEGNDTLYGEGGDDVVLGGTGDDVLWGDAAYLPEELHAADFLDGGAGDDILYGGAGEDTLLGGAGNDTLDGGEGGDAYVFRKGDGSDVIADTGVEGVDTLVLEDLSPREVRLRRLAEGALEITAETGERLLARTAAGNPHSGIEAIRFADGSLLDQQALDRLPIDPASVGGDGWTAGTAGDDLIDGGTLPVTDPSGHVLIDAGAGNDEVYAPWNAIVHGGPGNDTLIGGQTLLGGEGDDTLAEAVTLVGGPGNDTLLRGGTLVGGPGDDLMDGGHGATRYFIDPAEPGVDLIHDTGESAWAYLNAYYTGLGIEDWEYRRAYGGHYALWGGEGEAGGGFYETLEELEARLADSGLTLEAALASGDVTYIEPLPAPPVTSANDFQGLQPAYAAGVIEQDTVDFSPGISPADLRLAWGQVVRASPTTGEELPYVTLDLSWVADRAVRVVIPRSDEPLGSGVEQFRFADGSSLSLAELIALAPPAPSFDPHAASAFTFERGTGRVVIDDPAVTEIAFGPGITPEMLSLTLGSLVIRVGGEGDEIHLPNFDPENAYGSAPIERLRFAGGTVIPYGELIDRGFDLVGTRGDDMIAGTSAADRIEGGEGDDTLSGGAGDDRLDGGPGADVLMGGPGSDIYLFGRGFSQDVIEDFDATGLDLDTLALGPGVSPDELIVTQEGSDLRLRMAGSEEAITVRRGAQEGFGLERVLFADGTMWDAATLKDRVNDAPRLAAAPGAREATEDTPFHFVLPADTFADPDTWDRLTYHASLADGSALPAWLAFDPEARTFSGTPANEDVGCYALRVTATDRAGAAASDTFELAVVNVNDPPALVAPIPGQWAQENVPFSFRLAAGTFIDLDGKDELTYAAMLADGGSLPAWLAFDPATQTFAGTPGNEDVGNVSVRVAATDPQGASAADEFDILLPRSPARVLEGTAAADHLPGGTGHDTLFGGNGDDVLEAGAGEDRLSGGAGADLLLAGSGDDTLVFSADGRWSARYRAVNVGSPGISGPGKAVLLAGRQRSFDVFEGGAGYDVLRATDGHDALFLDDPYSPSPQKRGPRLSGIELIELGAGNDVVDLTSDTHAYGDVTIDGGAGRDVLWASSGNDWLDGGHGNDALFGGAGNDTLVGGEGHDRLEGGTGDDTYLFGRGYGKDVIVENDAPLGNRDAVQFLSGIAAEQLWLRQVKDDLEVRILGTSDRLLVEDWYQGPEHRVEEFRTADGQALLESQVQALVDAMAFFAPSSAGDANLPPRVEEALAPVIAANWQ